MTEMAPVGYVGISPKCLLGFNKVRFVTAFCEGQTALFCADWNSWTF